MFAGAPMTLGALPSLGSLLGTTGNQQLVKNINESLGSAAFFGSARDMYASVNNAFIENIIVPIRQTVHQIQDTVKTFLNPDSIRPLVTQADFKHIPPCMQLPLLMHPQVRKLLEEGRIAGFGANPAWLPKEDAYGRLINNGAVDHVLSQIDKDGRVEFVNVYESTDPIYSWDELDAIAASRRYMEIILRDTKLDPTDIGSERG